MIARKLKMIAGKLLVVPKKSCGTNGKILREFWKNSLNF
jgi:hypothetical protein